MRPARTSSRRLAFALVGCAVATATIGFVVAQTAGGPAPVDRRALIESGDSPDLFLLYTGSVIGYLDPCG